MKRFLIILGIYTLGICPTMAQINDEDAANSDCMQTVSLRSSPTTNVEQEDCYRNYYKGTTKQSVKKVIVIKSRCISQDSGYPIYLRKLPNYDSKIIHKIPVGTILNQTIGYDPIPNVQDLGCFTKIIYNGEEYFAISKKLDRYCGDKPAVGVESAKHNASKNSKKRQ